jgi:hypothetical protein
MALPDLFHRSVGFPPQSGSNSEEFLSSVQVMLVVVEGEKFEFVYPVADLIEAVV